MTFTRDHLFIGGRWVEPEGGAAMPVINPATEEIIGSAPIASAKDTASAVAAARQAFDEGPWGRTTPKQRGEYIRRLAEALERRRAEITGLIVGEAGMVAQYADPINVAPPIEWCFDMADRLLPTFSFRDPVNPYIGPTVSGLPALAQGVILREPVGVASLITPFNGPTFVSFMKLVPALAAGCTVVLKPSPYTPLEVLAIGDLVQEAGFPAGVVNIISGETDASIEMTTNPGVDIISFTGSDAVGRMVMAQAAPDLKRVVLELGGKNALIVFADADPDRVALEVASNTTFFAGQGCMLLTRTLVQQPIHDEVVAKVIARLDQVTVGDPSDPAVSMGPLIRDSARTRIEGTRSVPRRPTGQRSPTEAAGRAISPEATSSTPLCSPASTTRWRSPSTRSSVPSRPSCHSTMKMMPSGSPTIVRTVSMDPCSQPMSGGRSASPNGYAPAG